MFTVVLIFFCLCKLQCVLLDLSKAFYCIEQNTFLDKLYQYGVCGIKHKLIRSFLTSRTKQMKVTHVANIQLKK
jgi:hypothetical protein